MKYRFFITITVEDYPYFIELGKQYELFVHFNLTDKLWFDDLFCDITEIFHNIDDDEIWLKLNVTDPKAYVENETEAIDSLKSDIEELKEYDWYLNDYDLGDVKSERHLFNKGDHNAIGQRKESENT